MKIIRTRPNRRRTPNAKRDGQRTWEMGKVDFKICTAVSRDSLKRQTPRPARDQGTRVSRRRYATFLFFSVSFFFLFFSFFFFLFEASLCHNRVFCTDRFFFKSSPLAYLHTRDKRHRLPLRFLKTRCMYVLSALSENRISNLAFLSF